MNVQSKSGQINWRKYIPVVIILLIAGYTVGQPHFEPWLGIKLPSVNGRPPVAENQRADAETSRDKTPRYNSESRSEPADKKDRNAERGQSVDPGLKNASQPALTSNFKLQDLGGEKFQSPAGLIYRRSSAGEHRIDHIMRHAIDDPNRAVHGVFEKNGKNQILALIDAAYKLAAGGSNRVAIETRKEQPYRVTYTIDMQQKIGFQGGRNGKRDRFPPLNKLRLVIDNGNQVITAYPDD